MSATSILHSRDLAQRLSEAEATISALLSGQIDSVIDTKSNTVVLLANAQEALRKSEEQYRQIVEATTDGIVRLDQAAGIIFVNRRFAEMLGRQASELIGTNVFLLMNAAAMAKVGGALRLDGTGEALDTTFRHVDGTEIFVNIVGTPLLDGGGRHTGDLWVVRDVTERTRLQTQLMVSDRMASVGTLAAGVAHEINNPLGAVIANLDYIAESLTRRAARDAAFTPGRSDLWYQKDIRAPLDDAREAAEQVRSIVRDLKVFSRSPSEEPHGPVDVQLIMDSSLRMAWNEIRHRARLVKNYGDVPCIEANEARLGQVFLNLIVNAAQALPEGRAGHNEIRVTTRLDGERVIVEVSDTGAGIPPDIIDRIFDVFFTTKAIGVGTGLGLAICRRIVTDMGGELTVESTVGTGTTFRVAIPISSIEEAGAPAPAAPAAPEPAGGPRGRILVVDDDELVLRAVKRILSRDHDVVATTSGKEALALCTQGGSFDLIICDLMMPDMTGMDIHRELLKVAPVLANRMLFATGGAFTPEAQHFLSETPKEHIEKPFASANLRAIVERYRRYGPA